MSFLLVNEGKALWIFGVNFHGFLKIFKNIVDFQLK